MTAEAYKALDMLNAFASVGVKSFDVTFTDIDGKKPGLGGFLPNRHINGLRPTLGHMLQLAVMRQQNIILRPRKSERAELIQLDDLNEDTARHVAPYSFMTLCTSPGNFQAWVAVADANPDFARRLRKGAGADPSASGATRISGSVNFKAKYAPTFPLVEITESREGNIVTRDALERAGLVAPPEQPKEPIRVSPTYTGPRKWPSYTRCVANAPPVHGGDHRPDISKADFTWCMTAIDWGWSIEATAARLMEESAKAQENGEHYALTTAQNAAGAIARRRAQAR
jgi:RepB DNA-primase from phage plasmid